MKKITYILSIFAVAISFSACEKIITFYPEDDSTIPGDEALTSPEAAQELLNSVYDVEANFLSGQVQNLAELLADNNDDPTGRSDDYTQLYNRRTDFFNGTVDGVFRDAYIAIYRANTLIEKVVDIPGMTPENADRIIAEARFIRGLNHYMIVRLFAQPYGYTPNNTHLGITIRTNPIQTPLPRNTVAEVYSSILSDLEFAAANLPESNGVYATKYAAIGLLADVHLEMGDFSNALIYANEIISTNLFDLDNLDRFEGSPSTENIFYITSTNPVDERGLGYKNNYRSDAQDANPTLRTTKAFYDQATADTNDMRGKLWFRVINPGESNEGWAVAKYDFSYMNVPIVYYTRVILVKAECLYEASDYAGCIAELNKLRARAGAENYGIMGANDTYNALQSERRLELCFEGDRIFQLKRQAVLGRLMKIRNAPWDCDGLAIQFPNSEGTGGGFVFNPEGGCN